MLTCRLSAACYKAVSCFVFLIASCEEIIIFKAIIQKVQVIELKDLYGSSVDIK